MEKRMRNRKVVVISSDSEDDQKDDSMDVSYVPDSPKKPKQTRAKSVTKPATKPAKVKTEDGEKKKEVKGTKRKGSDEGEVKKPKRVRTAVKKEEVMEEGEVKKPKRLRAAVKKEEITDEGEVKKPKRVGTAVKKEEVTEEGEVKKPKRVRTAVKKDEVMDGLFEPEMEDEKKNIKLKIDYGSVQCREWTESEYVSETSNVDQRIAENVVRLFNEENTIPFIARYRKNMTGGMEPDQLRALKESYDQAKLIKQRAATILKSIDKLGQWTAELHSAIKSARSLDDLEHIYSAYKPASKRSLAERARELGLGPISESVLNGNSLPHLASLVNPEKEGLRSEVQVKDGIVHIIADLINKDKEIFDKVKDLQKTCRIEIQTSQCKSDAKAEPKDKKENDEKKYEMYYNFSISEKHIKPHHILAINRAESQKILSVKVQLPDYLERAFKRVCMDRYRSAVTASKFHMSVLNDSVDYAYKKFIKPLVTRRIRSEMKTRAEVASIEVFVTNVKQLLLTAPVRGKVVLGIDPGFYHGCKLAVVSEQGALLDTGVIYPHKSGERSFEDSARALDSLITRHKCKIIALGNATACRETELFLSRLIKSWSLDVSYAIVDESGASIYSCSPEAKAEFPSLDPNLISAVSIARRLQDPLAELVKVEPKHLGVGMYQHDLPEKQLLQSLNEVVSEAVSFVGVDVNTASQSLLKRVAGLNVSRASSILEWRAKNGPFKNREQLLSVKGIGAKSYEQCAGFIRILPETAAALGPGPGSKGAKGAKGSLNPLDQTWIHPESYNLARRFMNHCGCDLKDLGTPRFIEAVKSYTSFGQRSLAENLGCEETTLEVIVKGLCMRKDEDIRLKDSQPLFRASVLSLAELQAGTTLTGAVRNVTHFGAFVDVGVGRDGLLHVKHLKGQTLAIGQRVEVKVIAVEAARNRISLDLIRTL